MSHHLTVEVVDADRAIREAQACVDGSTSRVGLLQEGLRSRRRARARGRGHRWPARARHRRARPGAGRGDPQLRAPARVPGGGVLHPGLEGRRSPRRGARVLARRRRARACARRVPEEGTRIEGQPRSRRSTSRAPPRTRRCSWRRPRSRGHGRRRVQRPGAEADEADARSRGKHRLRRGRHAAWVRDILQAEPRPRRVRRRQDEGPDRGRGRQRPASSRPERPRKET